MKFTRTVAVLLVASFTLAACAQDQGQKQTVGTLLGAGAGALLGSQLGGGKGQLLAVAVGALGGALLGSELGRSLDDNDKMRAAKTQQVALESNRSGQASNWVNPDSGHSGRVVPQQAYTRASGETCRNYEHTVTIEGRSEVITGTACRQPDGTWRAIN